MHFVHIKHDSFAFHFDLNLFVFVAAVAVAAIAISHIDRDEYARRVL